MQRYFDYYRDQSGNGISGASVSVYIAGTNTLATIYEPDSNAIPQSAKANPFTTDATGFWTFAAADGPYAIRIEGAGSGAMNVPYVALYDSGGVNNETPLTVFDFGAVGDGTTDDTAAIQAAVTYIQSGGTIYFPNRDGGLQATFQVTSKITVNKPITLKGLGGKVWFNFPVGTSNADGRLFDIASSDVTFDSMWIDATGVTGTITGVNRYAISCEPGGSTRYSNIKAINCKFTNLTQYSGSIPATTTVMHAIYAKQVDDLLVTGCEFNTISGSPVYLIDTERARIRDNSFIKFGWSGVWLNNANLYWEICNNTFSGTTSANPSYWGGAIDVMGQTSDASSPGEPDENGLIDGNIFAQGVYRYGQVVRLSSSRKVVVTNNVFDRPDADQNSTPGGGGPGSNNIHIMLTVRDVTLNNGPHKFITVANNIFIAAGAGWQLGIYARTTSGSNTNTTPCEGLIVENNQFVDYDASNYFMSAMVLHGFNAGYNDITFRGNVVKATPHTTVNYEPASLAGALVLIANAAKTVQRAVVTDNIFTRYSGNGTGNNDTAINVYSDVTDVDIRDNAFIAFFRDITVNASNTGNVPIQQNIHNRAAGGTDYNLRGVSFASMAGTQVTAANTISATGTIFHVTGATVIKTINLPNTGGGSNQPVLTLVPDTAFTTDATGNIRIASTAVVSRAMTMTYDGSKWNPSYV